MTKNGQKKQVFSISQKYNDVISILSNIENKSEFICQAIIEKNKGSKTTDDDLSIKIRQILKDMIIEDNLVVLMGNLKQSDIHSAEPSHPTPNYESNESNNIDIDESYIKDVLSNW